MAVRHAALLLLSLACLLGAQARGPAATNAAYSPSSCAARCTAPSNFQQPVPDVPNPNKGTRATQWSDLLLVLVRSTHHSCPVALPMGVARVRARRALPPF